jgi:hypothetical protein
MLVQSGDVTDQTSAVLDVPVDVVPVLFQSAVLSKQGSLFHQ